MILLIRNALVSNGYTFGTALVHSGFQNANIAHPGNNLFPINAFE